MNHSIIVETTLLSSEHPYISKHTSFLSVLVSLFIALLGIMSIIVSVSVDDTATVLCMTLLTLGTVMILVALYSIFWRSVEVIYIPTGSKVSEGSCFMDSSDLSELTKLIENKNFSLSSKIKFKQSGNGRMDYLISKDCQFAAVQLFHFVPYTYEPASQICYYTGDDAVAFVRYLGAKNN